ncbi:MAG: ATP-binding protein [Acidobacteria bacterium]|nr:ATP-binding protein [Acidobacteriota bacterium]
MELLRRHYLDRLRQFLDAPAITAVTGIRRAGKSVLLRQLAASLRDERQVVYVDKEAFAFEPVRTARDLIDLVESTTRRDEPRVVIVDEVQQIADWERAVASLNGEEGTEVVISGSNATLLSAELATLIAGRYVTLQVFPLTLAEFGDLYRQRPGAAPDDAELFRLYLRIGGLPGLLHTDLSHLVVDQMLADMVSTIAVRDVIRRHRIRDVALFEAILRFAVDSVGSLVSAKRIADFLKSQRRRTAVDTVLNYLAHLADAFLLTPVSRFDLRGRRLLQVNRKHYLGDVGLRNGVIGYREGDIGGVLENLVFLELRRRGYAVTVGAAGSQEIDFVAERRSGRCYVQVAYLLESPATIARELSAFSAVRDAYPRVLLTLDPHQPADLQGVRHQSLTDFLRGAPLGALEGDGP